MLQLVPLKTMTVFSLRLTAVGDRYLGLKMGSRQVQGRVDYDAFLTSPQLTADNSTCGLQLDYAMPLRSYYMTSSLRVILQTPTELGNVGCSSCLAT